MACLTSQRNSGAVDTLQPDDHMPAAPLLASVHQEMISPVLAALAV
jgi:hypothetical protein